MSEIDALPRSARRVRAALLELGLPAEIHRLADSTRTAPEAAAAVGCELGAIVKSLVMRGTASGEPVLDEDLLIYETVWAAAGNPHAVFPIAPAALAAATGASVLTLAKPRA